MCLANLKDWFTQEKESDQAESKCMIWYLGSCYSFLDTFGKKKNTEDLLADITRLFRNYFEKVQTKLALKWQSLQSSHCGFQRLWVWWQNFVGLTIKCNFIGELSILIFDPASPVGLNIYYDISLTQKVPLTKFIKNLKKEQEFPEA